MAWGIGFGRRRRKWRIESRIWSWKNEYFSPGNRWIKYAPIWRCHVGTWGSPFAIHFAKSKQGVKSSASCRSAIAPAHENGRWRLTKQDTPTVTVFILSSSPLCICAHIEGREIHNCFKCEFEFFFSFSFYYLEKISEIMEVKMLRCCHCHCNLCFF